MKRIADESSCCFVVTCISGFEREAAEELRVLVPGATAAPFFLKGNVRFAAPCPEAEAARRIRESATQFLCTATPVRIQFDVAPLARIGENMFPAAGIENSQQDVALAQSSHVGRRILHHLLDPQADIIFLGLVERLPGSRHRQPGETAKGQGLALSLVVRLLEQVERLFHVCQGWRLLGHARRAC